jgi:hypothetical protein
MLAGEGRNGVKRILLLGLTILCVVTGRVHASELDGPWSVVIVTQEGDCDSAYRAELTIEGTAINYAGGPAAPAGVVGTASKNGKISISFKNDKGSLSASGRMKGKSGSGVWRASNGCAGRWTADKRG